MDGFDKLTVHDRLNFHKLNDHLPFFGVDRTMLQGWIQIALTILIIVAITPFFPFQINTAKL